MPKTPLVPLKKNHKTQVLFVFLFSMLLLSQIFIILPCKYPLLSNSMFLAQQCPVLAYLITIFSLFLAVFFFSASVRDPGYLRPTHRFLDLLKEVHPCEMCPDCQVLRSARSKHCAICNRCCERFDHHCPWINNCVGINNHNSFICFIYSLTIVLILLVSSSCIGFWAEVYRKDKTWPL